MSFSPTGVKFKHHPQWRSSLFQIIMKGGEALLSVVFIVSLAGPMVFPGQANALTGVPILLSYQGRLTDNNGNPLTNTYCVRFSIYDAYTGGTKLWPAGTPTATTTAVSNGVFAAPVGEMDNTLGSYDFSANNTEYLNIDVYNVAGSSCTGGAWESLSPRQRLDAVAYARLAADVYGTALRTSSTAVGIGAGTGQGTPIWLNLDWKNTETALGGGCPSGSVNGSVWYNSNQTRALACVNNAVVLINNASDFSGIKESAAGSVVNAGSIILSNAGGISISQSTATLATNKTDQTIGTFGFSNLNAEGISTMGNTLGTNGTGTGSVFWAGGNNITLSQVTAAGARTITISALNQSAQPVAISGSNGSFAFSTVTFGNLNGLSFYTSNGSIVGSYTAGAGGDGYNAAQFTNSTANTSMPIVWAGNSNGSGNLTFGLTGSTVTGSAPSGGGGGATLSRWEYPQNQFTSLGAIGQGSLSILHMYVPFNITGTAMRIGGSLSAATNTSATTASANMSLYMGIYTLNGSSLSLASSGSANNGFVWSQTASTTGNTSINSMRLMSVPMNINMPAGEYWVGAVISSATTYTSAGYTMYGGNLINNAAGAAVLTPIGSNTTAAKDALLWQGIYTAATNAMPVSIANSAINNTSASNVMRANFFDAIVNATY